MFSANLAIYLHQILLLRFFAESPSIRFAHRVRPYFRWLVGHWNGPGNLNHLHKLCNNHSHYEDFVPKSTKEKKRMHHFKNHSYFQAKNTNLKFRTWQRAVKICQYVSNYVKTCQNKSKQKKVVVKNKKKTNNNDLTIFLPLQDASLHTVLSYRGWRWWRSFQEVIYRTP